VSAAQKKGLNTEQGIASYALAVWWLGLNFEAASAKLVALLNTDYPEVRKMHAMNEWVNAAIGAPDNIAAADEKLRQALQSTEAWGR
jgi:predicted GNAT superfamily acetyltransferase